MRLGSFLESMWSDNAGGISTMRVIFTFWMVSLIAYYGWACWHEKKLAEIPTGVVTITSVLAAAKALQRIGEKSE